MNDCTMALDPVIWARIERRASACHGAAGWNDVLRMLDHNDDVLVSEVMTALGISRNSARRMLTVLADLRVVRTERVRARTDRYLLNREDLWVLFA